jgi:hypothetical protein
MKPFSPAAAPGARIVAIGAVLLGGCTLPAPAPPPPGAVAAAEATAPVKPTPLGAPQGSAAAPAQTVEPDVTGPINGVYQGRERVANATAPACPSPSLGLIEIGDGTLLFPYTSGLIYVVAVPPNGMLHEAIGDAVLDGQLFNGDLDFSVVTADCKSTFSFRRRSGF